jgi:hypothetical protein
MGNSVYDDCPHVVTIAGISSRTNQPADTRTTPDTGHRHININKINGLDTGTLSA